MEYEFKESAIGYGVSKSDLPPSRHDRLMRKLERQIVKSSPKAHLTLAKLLKLNEMQCSGSKLAVGPFRQAPEFVYGGIDREPSPYWDKGFDKTSLNGLEGIFGGKANEGSS